MLEFIFFTNTHRLSIALRHLGNGTSPGLALLHRFEFFFHGSKPFFAVFKFHRLSIAIQHFLCNIARGRGGPCIVSWYLAGRCIVLRSRSCCLRVTGTGAVGETTLGRTGVPPCGRTGVPPAAPLGLVTSSSLLSSAADSSGSGFLASSSSSSDRITASSFISGAVCTGRCNF